MLTFGYARGMSRGVSKGLVLGAIAGVAAGVTATMLMPQAKTFCHKLAHTKDRAMHAVSNYASGMTNGDA